jgi:predicted O-methyltransferase YrrM
VNTVLAERYEKLCAGSSDIFEHLPTFVKAVGNLDATRVIELGVRSGVSTISWLYALENRGHLWSVDCSFPMPEEGELLLDPQGPLGVIPWWTFILGYDDWPETLAALPSLVDIVFIDTQHTYEQTLTELELYYPRVRPGGRIFLHDTAVEVTGNAVTPQPPFPVLTAVKEFCGQHNLTFENNPSCCGLGMISC